MKSNTITGIHYRLIDSSTCNCPFDSRQIQNRKRPSISFLCLAHFSTTVGAVHNSNYTLFQIGSYATHALSQFVLTGETFTLEQELANEVSIYRRITKKNISSLFLLNATSNVIEGQLVCVF